MKRVFLFMLIVGVACGVEAQETRGTIKINGDPYEYMVDECGDTLIMATLGDVSISSARRFDNADEFRKYRRYRKYAYDVYPYAAQAIRIFREMEYETSDLKNRNRKKYIRKLQRELKEEFEDPLKKLTRTQGMILFKMIERELDTPMFYLIKDIRSGFTASYWGTVGKLYGHDLKEGYIRGKDEILDIVLDDIDISYEMPERPVSSRE